MIEQTLDIKTAAGEMETFICRPERGGPFPAVFLLMDAPGIREELRDMVRRLGTVGYNVLLPTLYYRAGRDTIFGPDVLEEGSAERARSCWLCLVVRAPSARSSSTPASITASPSRCAGAMTSRPPSGTGSG